MEKKSWLRRVERQHKRARLEEFQRPAERDYRLVPMALRSTILTDIVNKWLALGHHNFHKFTTARHYRPPAIWPASPTSAGSIIPCRSFSPSHFILPHAPFKGQKSSNPTCYLSASFRHICNLGTDTSLSSDHYTILQPISNVSVHSSAALLRATQ